MDPFAEFLATLSLTNTGARTQEDIFVAQSEPVPQRRVFGGQVLAQAIVAAAHTVPADREIHSMHAYFLRPGDSYEPITFAVDRIHDGRSFTTRRAQAFQDGAPILSMISSFQDTDAGLEHQLDMPLTVANPESLPTTAELLGAIDNPFAQHWANRRPFDIRHVPSPIYLSVNGSREPRQAVWMRTLGEMPDSPVLHRAGLAYATDYIMLEPAMRVHGLPWTTPGLKVASLDHAMWWHRDCRIDEWLLFVQESPSTSGGRALGEGRVFTRDGVLVASVVQEGMMRVPQG